MNTLQWSLATIGILFGLGIAAAVLLDMWLYTTGRTTISRWLLSVSRRWPIIPAALGLAVGFAVGCLCGHWWFPLSE